MKNKRNLIVAVNVVLMAAILVFISVYTANGSRKTYENQLNGFVSITVAMEKVTENYLSGEQGICDVWARHINTAGMTIEEAADFIRRSHVLDGVSAHVVYVDGEYPVGISTRSRVDREDDYAVSYKNIDIIPKTLYEPGTRINITRAYTNPVNGLQSIAFCDRLTLKDPDGGADRDAVLLRIIPVSDLQEKWVFPMERYGSAQLSMIDSEGSYIIRGSSFKNFDFFEFYNSYNPVSESQREALKAEVRGNTDVLSMKDSHGEPSLVAHTPILITDGWILLNYVPQALLKSEGADWLLLGTVFAGLALLFVADLIFMMYFNKRLKLSAEAAETANRAKTDFLSTMSHDIRTPMNAIVGLTAIAEKGTKEPETAEYLKKIRLAGGHLLTLINDILDISKIESGKLTLNPVAFSIVETASNLVNISQPTVKAKNLDFDFRINSMDKENLYADQLRLNQIFINLLSNAIKYTDPGGRVWVDMKEEKSEKPGCVRLVYTVSDNGSGMSEEFQKRMFEPFSRQTDSRISNIQGTGLGLAITKRMIDLMEGTIECRSRLGVGTVFCVTLDLPEAKKQLEDMNLDGVEALLADDDPALLDTARDTLISLGASVETASSGAEAVEMIRRRHESGGDYGVAIVDLKMPDMNGVETVRIIRRDLGVNVPVLLISAYDWSDIERDAKDAGVNGFVSKPLFRSTLYEKISSVLELNNGPVAGTEDNSDLEGMRVLVAEDNDINWEIISELLMMYGIKSERADNGKKCLDMIASAPLPLWDLVFMDVQMPVMNGLDAARAIRALEDPERNAVPIIAMTADAFSENVAACLEAGMNGHIAKPVDIKLVIKEIRGIKERRNKK